MQAKEDSPKTSLIIPVYNQWRFTKACLEALAATIHEEDCEIIIVDNGSTDETVSDCELFGKTLFGSRFRYKRLATNCNFGPASNIGARLARGEFLLFLNNDTEPLPGWYHPLFQDFTDFTNIAATGPLLLYPKAKPFGHTVQHLGVTVTPFLSVSHLYEGIPESCSLTKKRRFFQIITAACMLVPKSLFFDAGMFDEHYINGVEDIDLCTQLFTKGFRMTVNTSSRVIHYTSQTPGREKHETENFHYFQTHCQPLLTPDFSFHLDKDGLELRLSPWLVLSPHCKKNIEEKLDFLPEHFSLDTIVEYLQAEPFWEQGWDRLSDNGKGLLEKAKLFPSPENYLALFQSARARKEKKLAQFALNWTMTFYKPWDEYIKTAKRNLEFFAACHDQGICTHFAAWLKKSKEYKKVYYDPFMQKTEQIVHRYSVTAHAP